MRDVLVTDSQFVFDEHIARLARHGLRAVRLDKVRASEDELCSAIRGKVGYILGGIEQVTDRVLESADVLKIIAFAGSGYAEFIPGHSIATKKRIAISNAKGGNARSVAEFALGFIIAAARKQSLVTALGLGPQYITSKSLQETVLGIVGFGTIGRIVASMALSLGIKVVATKSRVQFPVVSGVDFVDLTTLCQMADVISLHVDKGRGEHVLNSQLIAGLRPETAIVNCAFVDAVDVDSLQVRLRKGELFAYFDANVEKLRDCPLGRVIMSNAQAAFNTIQANKYTSDIVVNSVINFLETGYDERIVNPRIFQPDSD